MSDTPPPATIYVGSQEQEYTQRGADNIADASGAQLVDAQGDSVVDNGVTEVPLPQTVYTENDSE